MSINKDTKIYGSFSAKPGNTGCKFHNRGFKKLKINAIYKPFKVYNLQKAFEAMRSLGIAGAGVSMPFKEQVIKFADNIDHVAEEIGAANTVVNDIGVLRAYNTDWVGAYRLLENTEGTCHILGAGGLSKAVKYACKVLGKEYKIFNRDNWDEIHQLRDVLMFNCTPMNKDWVKPHVSNVYIDCLVDTPTGDRLAEIQASEQFKIYTGHDYPFQTMSDGGGKRDEK